MEEKPIGKVSKYFGHIGVAAVEVESDSIKVGDKIHIKGHTTDFEQMIDSIQIEHEKIQEAKPGDSVGIKVTDRVRPNDVVYKIIG